MSRSVSVPHDALRCIGLSFKRGVYPPLSSNFLHAYLAIVDVHANRDHENAAEKRERRARATARPAGRRGENSSKAGSRLKAEDIPERAGERARATFL